MYNDQQPNLRPISNKIPRSSTMFIAGTIFEIVGRDYDHKKIALVRNLNNSDGVTAVFD